MYVTMRLSNFPKKLKLTLKPLKLAGSGVLQWEKVMVVTYGRVNIDKNLNTEAIPANLTLGGTPIASHNSTNAFAKFFSEKITSHVNSTTVSPNVYNGKNM